LSVIDTINRGFQVVNRRLWIIIVPILLDLFLWLGQRLSVDPLMDQLVNSGYWNATGQQMIGGLGKGMNLFSLLSFGLPSLLPFLDTRPALFGNGESVVQISNGVNFLVFFLGLGLGGMLLTCLYLTPIAHSIRDSRFSAGLVGRRVGLNWLRLLGFSAVLIAAGLVASIPFAALAFLGVLGADGAVLLLGVVEIFGLWVAFFLFFAMDSIMVSEAGPLRAIYNSFNVVRRNFWSSLLLVIVTLLISQGMPLAWKLLAASPWGLIVGIIGNAYIGTGLVAASMIFYLDRYGKWQSARKAVAARP
jgi:hypothetical protein